MAISGTSLHNAYAGNYFFGAQSRSAQASIPVGADSAVPVDAAKAIKPGNDSVNNPHNVTASGDRNTEHNKSEQTNTRSPRDNNRGGNSSDSTAQLSDQDLKTLQQLKQRDREVRAHEAAHLAAAGKYATGGASFEYKRGPDGNRYAVGGEVSIDTSPVPNDPLATIQKARQIRAAAQAPAKPSSADRQVAASAARMEAKARQEAFTQRLEEKDKSSTTNDHSDITKAEKDVSAPRNNGNTAVSAYREFDAASRSEDDSISPLDLTA